METAAPEKRQFQAEVKQLLKLMIHSLYSHREIFLRELISNASDAADKLRFQAIAQPELLGGDSELKIWIDADPKAGTLFIRDNGIGMTREEAVAHLGTIAKSGTSEFFKSLSGDQQKDSQLIGQFGVGFYSAFIVADKVEVLSRKAGTPEDAGVRWVSSADGEFTVEDVKRPERGTAVILHLKDDAKEFADPYRLRSLIRRYSDHISFPVMMRKEGEASLDYEAVNQATALWARPRTEVTDEEYRGFYKHISHDPTDPLAWSHNKVEGKREYTSLLYVPGHAPFDLWQRDAARGLKLYVRRVFIMDDAEQFLPLYLRFIKGVIDSNDLPLNVSRELLQQDPEIDSMRGALTRRVLDLLTKLARDEPEKYRGFWREFGRAMKEGVVEDPANRERVAKLLRFSTTHKAEGASESEEQTHSLEDYIGRMAAGQDRIYYVTAATFNAARSSPHLEVLRRKGVEALLLYDRVDEWIMGHLTEFEGKKFQDVSRGDLELGALFTEADKSVREADVKENKALLRRIKEALGDRVTEVQVSSRLTDSPSCLVHSDQDIGAQLRQLLEASGQKLPENKPLLELNVQHPLVKYLDGVTDAARFGELAQLLYDQALLADGEQLADPADFVRRLNQVLLNFGTMRA